MKRKSYLAIFLILLLFLFSLVLQSCATFQQKSLTSKNPIDSILVSNFFKSSQAAISVYDLTDDKVIYDHNSNLLLHPASNQKILTGAAAYLFLGDNYKFKTEVYHSGIIKDSVCYGNIYFVGGFDPDFTSSDLDSLIDNIKSFGIKKIEGNLYADVSAMDTLFWGKGWMWDDDPYSFMPYLTLLNINKDNIKVVLEPSSENTPAKISLIPRTSFFDIDNSCLTSDTIKSKFLVTRDWINRKNKIIVKGVINKNSKPDTTILNIFNPTIYFLQLAKESFIKKQITLTGILDTASHPSDAVMISSFEREIEPVLNNMNKNSDNLNAEMMLRALAFKKYGNRASAKRGLKLIDSLITLSGYNPKNYFLVDGSGLSSYNLVSADLINGVLSYIYKYQPNIFNKLYNSFPISGYDGSLANRMKNSKAFMKVHAKTGTLNGVSTLSGYLKSKSNHMIAFSILIQNYVGPAKQARDIQDQICEMIYQLY
jgi:D-alanyl-D-alanine carboxypeptidase/D-alanyl-D-alanine-endopeptidase (penicillin-binding protein 4)